ncbi:hypothetical protein CDEF62S_05155 [Castellaniella defragrans]
MPNTQDHEHASHAWPAMASTALRVAFGIIWVVNVAFTWTDQFAAHYVGYLHNARKGSPPGGLLVRCLDCAGHAQRQALHLAYAPA